jgi:hypothetical protein
MFAGVKAEAEVKRENPRFKERKKEFHPPPSPFTSSD